jgi:hypothetical protein
MVQEGYGFLTFSSYEVASLVSSPSHCGGREGVSIDGITFKCELTKKSFVAAFAKKQQQQQEIQSSQKRGAKHYSVSISSNTSPPSLFPPSSSLPSSSMSPSFPNSPWNEHSFLGL